MVAEHAEVAVGTIYLRYPNKQALLGGVIRAMQDELASELRTAAQLTGPWRVRFHHIFGSMIRSAADRPEMAAIMGLSSHADLGREQDGHAIRAAIARIVATAQGSGAFLPTPEPDVVASVAYGMVEGAMNHMMSAEGRSPEVYIAALSDAASRWLIPRDG